MKGYLTNFFTECLSGSNGEVAKVCGEPRGSRKNEGSSYGEPGITT